MELIYLDICCFNRPYDDQSQLLIHLQTEAKLFVQEAIKQGLYSLVWSAILDLENTANPDAERREAIQGWQTLAAIDIEATSEVECLAGELTKQGLKPMDALHVASAIKAEATWFLTTDNGLLRRMKGETRLAVVDPVDFIRSLQEVGDEN